MTWRMATRLLGLASTLIIVRLLVPADFGLVALGTSFITAVDTLSAIGIEDALVRQQAPSNAMYNTAFTLTAFRGAVTTLLIAIAAAPIGSFFGEPRLAYILWALAAGTLITGFGSIGVVDFRRKMAFDKEFLLQILPRIVSIVVTVACAWTWHSYWALVAGILTSRAVRTIFGYWMHVWRPRFTLSAWRDLIGFSLWSWAISMAELGRDRVDMFVIGRVMSPAAVGVYALGEELGMLPGTEIVLPLCRACFPAFVEAARMGKSIEEAYTRSVAATFLITLPAGLGVSLEAEPLTRLIMGEKWTAAISIIQLLGIAGSLMVFGCVATTLVTAAGLMRRQFTITVSCLGLRLLLLVVMVNQFGLIGAGIGAFCGLLLEHIWFLVVVFRRFGFSVINFLHQIWRSVLSGWLMAMVLFGTGFGWTPVAGETSELVRILIEIATLGAATYIVAILTLWWMSGRPSGPEADMLAVFVKLVRRFTVRSRPARL